MSIEAQPGQGLSLPAILDETRAPELAVLTRISEAQLLCGRIESRGAGWAWHFVLDTDPVNCAQGTSASYEDARQGLVEALAALGVAMQVRRDAKPPLRAGERHK